MIFTCRQVHKEALPVLYVHVTFSIKCWAPLGKLESSFQRIGDLDNYTLLQQIRRLRISPEGEKYAENLDQVIACTEATLVALGQCSSIRALEIIIATDSYSWYSEDLDALMKPFTRVRCAGEVKIVMPISDITQWSYGEQGFKELCALLKP